MQERGHTGEIDETYAAETVAVRADTAGDHNEATYDPSPTVRRSRARAAGLTEDEQDTLAGDERPRVRAAVAQNPATAPTTLDALADDEDRRVREAAARHPATPPESLERMSRHLDRRRDLSVVRALASNPRTPDSALGRLHETGTGGWRAVARSALRERADQAATGVLAGAERLGKGLETTVDGSAGTLDEALGLEPQREAKVR